ncbi:T9SS type A sorting domain-containing protein, partial [bacterium]|nr:T9SS type A sorting domain-containing protein [bacterium]
LKLYVDGKLEYFANFSSDIPISNDDIYIGKYYLVGGLGYFHGIIDDIRIYNRTLTDSQIDSLYHEGGWILPQSDNLVVNPSFENGLDNWNPYQYSSGWSSSTNNPHSGLKCAEFNFPGGSGYYDASMKQTGDHLYVQAGIPYYFSFWRRETDTHDTHTASETILDVDLILNGVNYSHPMPNMSPSNTWVQIDTTISFPENGYVYIDFQLHGYATSNSAIFAVDDIVLCQITENSTVTIPTLSTFLNDTVLVPVNVEFPTGKYYDSAELKFSAYQNGLEFIGVDTSSSMTGGAGWSNAVNETGDSLIISWFAGAEDISGSGVFCRLKFVATGEPCNFVPINIESALFNTGGDPVSITNGGVYIKPIPFYGDVDSNGEIQAHDAALTLKHVIEVETLDCQGLANADVTLNDTVTALDASIILQYGVGLIDTLPYDTSNGSLLAKGSITMKDGNYVPGQVVEVPLTLSGGGNILSFEGCLSYKPEQLVYNDIEWSHVTEGFLTEVDESDGRLVFAGAGSVSDGESGVFATVRFVINAGFSGVETTVSLDKLRLNEGAVKYDVAVSTLSRGTAIDLDISGIPTEYFLSQSYPNPFNPVTTIQYAIPEKSHVTLTIYNIAGQALEVLENQSKEPGYYSVKWDASKVGSGIYLYRVQAGQFTDVKKCVILK